MSGTSASSTGGSDPPRRSRGLTPRATATAGAAPSARRDRSADGDGVVPRRGHGTVRAGGRDGAGGGPARAGEWDGPGGGTGAGAGRGMGGCSGRIRDGAVRAGGRDGPGGETGPGAGTGQRRGRPSRPLNNAGDGSVGDGGAGPNYAGCGRASPTNAGPNNAGDGRIVPTNSAPTTPETCPGRAKAQHTETGCPDPEGAGNTRHGAREPRAVVRGSRIFLRRKILK